MQRMIAAAVVLICVTCATTAMSADAKVLIRGARVFDGEEIIGQRDVLIAGGTIKRVEEKIADGDAVVIDAAGQTLLPGLIDCHVHILSESMLQKAAAFGVTTELDMFMLHHLAAELRQRPDVVRADFRTAGTLVTAPRGHGTQFGVTIPTLTAPEDAQAFVDARLAEGSDYIKIIYDDGRALGLKFQTISRETLAATIAATHKRQKLAVVHVTDQQSGRAAVEADADGLAHIFGDSVADDAFIRAAKERGLFITPTLAIFESLSGAQSKWADDANLEPMLSASDKAAVSASLPITRLQERLENAKKSVRALHDTGLTILAGTDSPNPGTVHGASMHRELELLVECGLSPMQALTAATFAPAKAFGMSDRGRVAPGLRADLVLVDGDPTRDIKLTRAIRRVWVAGKQFDRDAWRNAADESRIAANAINSPGALMVSDFEDDAMKTSFGLGWSTSTDRMQGGKSTAELKVVDGGADGSRQSLRVSGRIDPAFVFAWAGAMFTPGAAPMQPVDLSAKKSITFWAKGDGSTVRIMLFARSFGFRPAFHGFTSSPDWQRYTFEISEFRDCTGKDVMGLLFTGGPGIRPFEFQIDQVKFE